MEFKEATKSIFMQCLNEPDIIEAIKSKIIKQDDLATIGDYDSANDVNIESANSITVDVAKKIDKILESQDRIEKHFNSGTDEDIERLQQELNSTRVKYEKEIEKIKREQEEDLKKSKDTIEELRMDVRKREDEIERVNNEKDNEISELNTIIQKKDCHISDLKIKYSLFDEILTVWNNIRTLNEENREYIYNLTGGDELLSVISLGRDDGKIEQLWQYLRDFAVKENAQKSEIEKLNCYFEFCIKVYNSTKTEEERYIPFEIAIDEEFDKDKAIRTADSRQFGKISEVIAKHYTYKNNNKFKAIVRVE